MTDPKWESEEKLIRRLRFWKPWFPLVVNLLLQAYVLTQLPLKPGMKGRQAIAFALIDFFLTWHGISERRRLGRKLEMWREFRRKFEWTK